MARDELTIPLPFLNQRLQALQQIEAQVDVICARVSCHLLLREKTGPSEPPASPSILGRNTEDPES